MNAVAWRPLFVAAAAFNLIVGLGLMLVPGAVYAIAGLVPPSVLEPRLVGWLVTGLGIGYAIAASDPARHRGIVVAGAIGKFGAVALVWSMWAAGLAAPAFALAVAGDLVFAVAFVVFLRRNRA